jgi:hypothetical protein
MVLSDTKLEVGQVVTNEVLVLDWTWPATPHWKYRTVTCSRKSRSNSSFETNTHVTLAAAIGTEVVWDKVDVRYRLPTVETVVS